MVGARTAAAARGVGSAGDDGKEGAVRLHGVPAIGAILMYLTMISGLLGGGTIEGAFLLLGMTIALLLVAIYLKMPEPGDE